MARLLVIDDDQHVRAMMREMLERDGHQVREADDGTRGVEAFTREPADLVVVDLYMPEQGGWDTIRALQAVSPGLPFVIVSGGGALEGVRRGTTGTLDAVRDVAAYRVLRKPFEWKVLSSAVNELLATRGTPEGRA
jgi:DNA-binding NtrC family response regulator